MEFQMFGNTLFPTDFTRELQFAEAKKAKQGTGMLSGRQIAFYILHGAHGKVNSGLMNNNLKPFDESRDEAVVFMVEEIADGMLSAPLCNTLEKVPSLMPEALEVHSSQFFPE